MCINIYIYIYKCVCAYTCTYVLLSLQYIVVYSYVCVCLCAPVLKKNARPQNIMLKTIMEGFLILRSLELTRPSIFHHVASLFHHVSLFTCVSTGTNQAWKLLKSQPNSAWMIFLRRSSNSPRYLAPQPPRGVRLRRWLAYWNWGSWR